MLGDAVRNFLPTLRHVLGYLKINRNGSQNGKSDSCASDLQNLQHETSNGKTGFDDEDS